MHFPTRFFVVWGLACAGSLAALQASEKQLPNEWPQLKGNAGFTGLSPDDTVKPPLKLVWAYRLDGDASGDAGVGVIVAGGKVFVSVANSHSLVALDADTGHYRWEHRDPSIGYVGYIGHLTVPAYDNGRVLLWRRHKSSAVKALDAKTGSVLWEQPLSPLGKDVQRGGLPIADGIIYCGEGGPEPAISALDTATGRRVWRTALGGAAGEYAVGPTVAGGRVFVATRAHVRSSPGEREWSKKLRGSITALDAKNGAILWRRENIYPWCPMTSDGTVLACPMWSAADEKLYLLDCRTGDTIWAKSRVSDHYYPPVTLTRDLVLYQPWGPRLHALSRTSGEPLWIFHNEFTSAGCCTPAVSGQYAYLGTSVPEKTGDIESLRGFRLADTPSDTCKYGAMNAIDLTTGKSVWRFSTTNTICGDPAIAYGRLYFAGRDGRAYCLAPAKKGEPATPEARDRSSPTPEADVVKLLARRHQETKLGSSWPMQGGGPERVNSSSMTLEPPLQLAWKYDTRGRVLASAAIVDGVVFAGSESGKIVAVDAGRGRKVWEFATGQPVRCSPAAAGGLVYCGSDSGILYALDAQTGKTVWQFETGGPIQASPAIAGDLIVFGANDHNLYALDRLTGRKLWNFRTSGFCIQAPPVIHGDRVFAAGWADWVWCLDVKSGKPIWQSFIPVSIEAVTCYRDRLWVRSPYYVVELDPAKGTWLRIANASYGYGGMAFAGDRLYQSGVLGQYGTNGATSLSLDDRGGPPEKSMLPTLKGVSIIKPQLLKGAPELAAMAAPLALGDKLCFATLQGKVILTRLDGTRLWEYELGSPCHAPPAAAAGLLVVGCDDGTLYAFRTNQPAK
jgi:outer membrane protein assembly factor BamB